MTNKNNNYIDPLTGIAILMASVIAIIVIVFITQDRGIINFVPSPQTVSKIVNVINPETEIKITGSPGLKFQGTYMSIEAGGASVSRSVEGVVPETFYSKGAITSVVFQKNQPEGFLEVTFVRNGQVVAKQSTTAEFGVVTVAK